MNSRSIFSVKGKPFFPLGGQVHNSSAYSIGELETGLKAIKEIKANMIEIPVYWEQIEPAEGAYDFSIVDEILERVRSLDLKLIFLWFGTWKNGTMAYTPSWIKQDPQRFERVITHDGVPLQVLSSHCRENLEADKKVFCALMEHICKLDKDNGTVIAVQVENEPGILRGAIRDHGMKAEIEFKGFVPEALIEQLKSLKNGPVFAAWQNCGSKSHGTWLELFGTCAEEFFTSWSIAGYINELAREGKEILKVPMYVNVWLDMGGWNIPGLNYPSGGAVTKTLDIWKCAAPEIDIISPDIYKRNSNEYCEVCSIYSRPDNPLFIPESGKDEISAQNMFYAIADYNAVGYSLFGVEDVVSENGKPLPETLAIRSSFHAVSSALPLILRYSGTGKIHAVVQQEHMIDQLIDFGDYEGLILYDQTRKDHCHKRTETISGSLRERGKGLVIQAGDNEFYAVGGGYRLLLRKKSGMNIRVAGKISANIQIGDDNYISVEEGYFDSEDSWVCTKRRNGDEIHFGVWVESDNCVVKIVVDDI